jgi:membrane-associated two-gene conflict system component 1 (EACC1)
MMLAWRSAVEAEIRISGGDGIAEFAALWEWLRAERALTGAVRPVRSPPAETELGPVYELLAITLGSGGAGVALARSLTTWLQTRRPKVAITVTSPSGSVTLEASQVKDSDVMPLLQEILRTRDEP